MLDIYTFHISQSFIRLMRYKVQLDTDMLLPASIIILYLLTLILHEAYAM